MAGPLDFPDLFYFVAGAAFLGLTFQPAFRDARWFNLPLIYIVVGVLLGLGGLPVIDPMADGAEGGLQTEIVTHVSELIVIISLAGAGLAIDLKEGWRRWQPTWRLLGIAMPLTILAIVGLGYAWLGLGLASAMLLAASLAPTDPVLARSVQVGPPNQHEEDGEKEGPIKVGLTAEAGLNDGLAFPFVWFAITLALVASGEKGDGWFWTWLGFDAVYRVAAGIAIGWAVGWFLVNVIHSRFGDARQGAQNAALTVLAATFLSYGLTEAADGYGFLAVFVAARASRALTRGTEGEGYNREAHEMADQLEQILLALLLLWLGMWIGAGLWREWQLSDMLFGLLLIFVVRPLAGYVSLLGYDCPSVHRWKLAFFGVRGMGSIFYIAYGQTHALFEDVDAVWRVATMAILVSIVAHGFMARHFMDETQEEDSTVPPGDPDEVERRHEEAQKGEAVG